MTALAARSHGIDVFVDEGAVAVDRRAPADPPVPGAIRVQSAHDFVWRAARQQFDLVVYQLGNSILHAFMWPYLVRWPGLVALHDARLHHARGAALLSGKARRADYRAEFRASHPQVDPDGAELAVAGFDGPYYYDWPMLAAAVQSARLVAVHARGVVAELEAAWPDAAIDYVALGEGAPVLAAPFVRHQTRRDLGYGSDAIVFGVFGGLGRARRLQPILRAFAVTHAREPRARLVLAGVVTPLYDVAALIAESGVAGAVTLVDAPDDDAFDRLIAAADVSLNLRWPTARETSGPWLRALAAERPTVIVDLAHQTHVPTLDPRTWQARSGIDPVAIAIDLLDEDHSLRVAMHRLAADPDLRARLGRAGRAYWEREHTVARMADDYERVFRRAVARPSPAAHAVHGGEADAHARALVADIDPSLCELF